MPCWNTGNIAGYG